MKLLRDLEQALSLHRSKPALTHYSSSSSFQTVTYGELETRVRELAGFLASHGSRSGDLVMTYMNKSIDAAVALLATMYAGGVGCFLHARVKPGQVLALSKTAAPRFVILDRSTAGLLTSLQGADSVNRFVLLAGAPELIDASGQKALQHRSEENSSAALFAKSALPGYCLFTSGSTGRQKGVLISRDDLAARVTTEIEDYQISDADNLLSLLPFSFDVGLNQLLTSVLAGAHLIILNSWFPKDIIAVIKKFGISGISAVPTIWSDMLSFPRPAGFKEEIKTLRYITVSGGDLPRKQLLQLETYFQDAGIYKTYGQSETFRSGILKPRDFGSKMTSVGQPVKGTKVFILKENGTAALPDQEGEIIHYGAGTMLGYLNGTNGSDEKLRDAPSSLKEVVPGGKVIFTGDRGKIDSDGFLHVLGRQDGMIKTMGYRVYPKEIESCILEHPKARQAAVVGITDGRKGQAIIADVVSGGGLDAKELFGYLREKLPYYMLPEEIHFVPALPLSENGKIRYADIKGRHEERGILRAHSES